MASPKTDSSVAAISRSQRAIQAATVAEHHTLRFAAENNISVHASEGRPGY
jgi:hypothetical protein